MRNWKYIFGPVPSRRLGISLGVDIIPSKLCTLDCVYCEVGATDKRGLARKEYFPASAILSEVQEAVAEYLHLDHITLSGSGEPTLNSKIGDIIGGIKAFTAIPVAVLTNGTLFYLPEVRRELLQADIVSPSLDAASPEVFAKIDRPHPKLDIDQIIEGLAQFRKEYSGILWLEILFVDGLNDSHEELKKLKSAIDKIQPDKIHINTVVRPPVEKSAMPVTEARLEDIQKFFGSRSEIIGVFKDKHKTQERKSDEQEIISLLRRRAMTMQGLLDALMIQQRDLNDALNMLVEKKLIRTFIFEGQSFYQAVDSAP